MSNTHGMIGADACDNISKKLRVYFNLIVAAQRLGALFASACAIRRIQNVNIRNVATKTPIDTIPSGTRSN